MTDQQFNSVTYQATQGPERRGVVAMLAAAGVTGPILFTVVVIGLGLLNPGYSHVTMLVSELAAWPGGWVQDLNFIVFGVLMSAYAIGLHLGMREGRGGVIGPTLLVLSGVGGVVLGLFPVSIADGEIVVPDGHFIGFLLAFLGAGSGFLVLSRRMAGDRRWQSLATYALATGTAIVILFFALFVLLGSPDAPLSMWVGLVQRVTIVFWFAGTVVLALRLRRIAADSLGDEQ
jgi:hypothetical protein